jgi:trehalose-6-phosphate synthase
METIRIDIINPKAKKLLKDLADLNLIKINKEKYKSDFSTLLKRIRAKSNDEITLDDITKEVEQVRKSRYEN